MLKKIVLLKSYCCSYYKVLNVKEDATQEEIKRSFLDLAKKHHPDVGTISEDQFIKIKKAYDTLRDPDSRKRYDFQQIHGSFYQRQRMHYYYYSQPQSGENIKISNRVQIYQLIASFAFFIMGYYLIDFYLTPMTDHQIRRQNVILSRENYDSPPSVQEKRRKMFMQEMKQKKISTNVVQLKISTSAKQTTKSKNVRKNTIQSIPGISKQRQIQAPVKFDEYM